MGQHPVVVALVVAPVFAAIYLLVTRLNGADRARRA
jgi:hypothetical protein